MTGQDHASLWRNGAFLRLFSAGAISYVGSFVTRTALPLAAIYELHAGALEIAALRTFEYMGWLLIGFVAGAWVDRLRRRPIMILTDLGRAALLGSIPLAAIGGFLSLPQLLVVAFFAAILSVFFTTASRAYLPTVVPSHKLVPANSALSGASAAAEFTGFGVGGFLVQLLTAPIAIAIDAVSYVVSAALLMTIHRPEPAPPPAHEREPVLREIRAGIGIVMRSPVLRALMAAHAMNHVLWGIYSSVFLVFATQDIGLGAAAIGVIAALGGLGSLFGAAVAPTVAKRLGVGRAMILGLVGAAAGNALIPLAPEGFVALASALFIGQQLIGDSSGTIYEVLETSVTQTMVEPRALGRVSATVVFVTTLTALAGAVVGGLVAEFIGLRAALILGVIGAAAAALFVWFSRVRSMREIGVAAGAQLTPEELPLTE